jgi:membrane protein
MGKNGWWRRIRRWIPGMKGRSPLRALLTSLNNLWYHFKDGFLRKRLVLKSAALSYTTVLCLLPLLALTFSVTNFMLEQAGPDERRRIIDRVIVRVIPQVELLEESRPDTEDASHVLPTRSDIRNQVNEFLELTGSGEMGIYGILFFIFLVLSMLITIEHTFNDIWHIDKGRPWLQRISVYWSVVTLGLILIVAAVVLTGRWQATTVARQISKVPYLSRLLSFITPFVIFWLGLTFTYVTLPYTRVSLRAGFVGGIVAGTLLQVNNLLNTMYVFTVTSYREFYGGLGILPIFLVGLYVSWLIVLCGAQLTYSLEETVERDPRLG